MMSHLYANQHITYAMQRHFRLYDYKVHTQKFVLTVGKVVREDVSDSKDPNPINVKC